MRAVVLHKIWIERCSTFHESASSIIRIEYHETLKNNVHCAIISRRILLPDPETYRDKVDTMTSKLLSAFSREGCAWSQDHGSSCRLTDHSLNSAANFRPEISEDTS